VIVAASVDAACGARVREPQAAVSVNAPAARFRLRRFRLRRFRLRRGET
jgi:hypothetical protein